MRPPPLSPASLLSSNIDVRYVGFLGYNSSDGIGLPTTVSIAEDALMSREELLSTVRAKRLALGDAWSAELAVAFGALLKQYKNDLPDK